MRTRRAALHTLAAGLTVTLVPLPGSLRAQEMTILRKGRFTGVSGCATSGTVAIIERNGRRHVSIGDDFTFDAALDANIALSPAGSDAATILGPIGAGSGAQSYAIPADVDAVGYSQVWILDGQDNMPLGRARLA